jgi:hypothetical protein
MFRKCCKVKKTILQGQTASCVNNPSSSNPDSSSSNKVTEFLVKGFYWNRFQVINTSFQAFLQAINFTFRL